MHFFEQKFRYFEISKIPALGPAITAISANFAIFDFRVLALFCQGDFEKSKKCPCGWKYRWPGCITVRPKITNKGTNGQIRLPFGRSAPVRSRKQTNRTEFWISKSNGQITAVLANFAIFEFWPQNVPVQFPKGHIFFKMYLGKIQERS